MVETLGESVLNGIVGAITALVTWTICQYFNNTIVPWYKDKVYTELDIEGDWKDVFDFTFESDQRYIHRLKQKAGEISGTLDIIEGHMTSTMITTGYVRNGLVTLTYYPKNKHRIGMGTYLLRVVGDGRRLEGRALWYDINDSLILDGETALVRITGEPSSAHALQPAVTALPAKAIQPNNIEQLAPEVPVHTSSPAAQIETAAPEPVNQPKQPNRKLR